MDDKVRETLYLIQLAVDEMLLAGKITDADAGKQLVQVAYDYVVAGEISNARDVLCKCADGYFRAHMPRQRREDKKFDQTAGAVDDVFALDYFRKDGMGLA